MPKKVKGKTSLQRLASCGTHVFAKTILVAGNVCSFALAAGLVAVGAKQVNYGQLRAVLDAAAQRHLLLDPYTALIALGSMLMPLSMMGGWGALTGARRLLFTYFVLVLLAFTALIYLTVLCFLSAKSEQQLGSLVEAFWPLVAAALHQESALYDTSRAQQAAASAAHLLRSAGSLCSASAALLLLALWASSRIAGHDWMLARVALAMNLVTGVLGAGCIRLGVVLSTSAAPASTFFAVLGGFVVFASVAGSVGLFLRLRFVLMAHTLLLFLLSILMTAAAVMALTSGTQGILNLSSSGALTDTLRQVVLLCQAQESGGAVPSPPPSNSTSPDAAAANVTAVGAASILNCAVDPAAAQAWVQQHLIVLGAFGVLSLVMLLFNLLACCYMLAITRPDPETDSSEDEKRRLRRRQRRRRQRKPVSSDDSSDNEMAALPPRRSKKREAAAPAATTELEV